MNTDQFDTLTKRLFSRGGSRRELLRLSAVLALSGLHAFSSPATRATEVADAQCPAPPGFVNGLGGSRLAQTFKAQRSGRLTWATIYAVAPSDTDTDAYVVQIRNTTRKGKPGTTVLASTQVNNIVKPNIGQTTTVTANFIPGARVRKGTRYALAITGVGGAMPSLQVNNETACAGTLFNTGDSGGKFTKATGFDLVFDTVVTTA